MKFLVVLAGLIATACAQLTNCCSSGDAKLLIDSWEAVWGSEFSGRRLLVGRAVFDKLLEKAPGVADLFKRVNIDNPDSGEFKAHITRVVNGIDMAINLLDDPATFDAAMDHLSKQHSAWEGVRASHFDVMRESFGEILPQVIPGFNPDVWRSCYNRIADGIRGGLPA